jgi:type III restriction enzyme
MKVKAEYDIELPILTPSHTREFKGLESFDVSKLQANPLKLTIKDGVEKKVELIETVTQKKVGQKQVEIEVGYPESHVILQNITNRVMKEARLEGQFSVIYPHVKKYISDVFFGKSVDIDHESIRRQLCDSSVVSEIISILASAIGKCCVSKAKPEMKAEPLRLMEIDGFYWRRDWTELDKTVFNVTPCYNDFEKNFATFLDKANDINKFAKLAESYTRFCIEYLSARGAIRYYYPDFVAEQTLKTGDTCMWIIETKGWEDKDVPFKDARAKDWCKTVNELTGQQWKYTKVGYDIFNSSKYRTLDELVGSIKALSEKGLLI